MLLMTMNNNKGYKKLVVWGMAEQLAYEVYQATTRFPSEEIYEITAQARRCAFSIPEHIAAAMEKSGPVETRKDITAALESLFEVQSWLGFGRDVQLLTKCEFRRLDGLRKEVRALLWKFYRSI